MQQEQALTAREGEGGTTVSRFEYLYGLTDDEQLEVEPEDVLERHWDCAEPPLAVGTEVEVHQWKARPAEEFMPDASLLIEQYQDIVYEECGEDCVDSIKWDSPDLRGAAEHFVAEMNRHIHWQQAGRKVATFRYRLTSGSGDWDLVEEQVA